MGVRLDTVRRFALSLPETTEEPHFDKSSFRVKGKIFVTVHSDGKHLSLNVDPEEGRALLDSGAAGFEEIVWGKRTQTEWVRVVLAKVDRAELEELVVEAWRRKAMRVLAAYDEARA